MRVALLAAAGLLGGCSLWYRPVPVRAAIGKERTALAGDSFAVHRDPRFEVYGPGSQPVFDAYEQLNRAYRVFDRHFGAPTPRIAVVLYADPGKAKSDAPEHALSARGLTVMRFVRPIRSSVRERLGDDGYAGSFWPVGPIASRFLLASLSGKVDTASLARLPLWFRAATMSLVGGSGTEDDVDFVRLNRGRRLPLEHLLSTSRPTSADSTLDPYRRDDASDADRMLSSESGAFALFLVESEGATVMAALARGFLADESFEACAARFRVLPHSVDALEEEWQSWLSRQRPR